MKAAGLCGAFLVADVHLAGRVFTDDNHCKSGFQAMLFEQGRSLGRNCRGQLRGFCLQRFNHTGHDGNSRWTDFFALVAGDAVENARLRQRTGRDGTVDGQAAERLTVEGEEGGGRVERAVPLQWLYYRAFPEPKAAMRDGDWMVLGHWDGPDLGPGGSVRRGDTELIKKHKLTGFELYNMKKDPAQRNDLSAAEPARLAAMAEALRARYAEVQAEGRVWDVPARKPKKKD